MISKHSLSLAENIAVGLPEGHSIPHNDILISLMGQSYGALPYSEKWREEVLDVTSENTEHSAFIEAGSTRMAEIIRGAFEMVKTYGVPFATALANGTHLVYSASRLKDVAMRDFGVRFINVDNPFFESGIYPTEGTIKNTALSFTSVGLDMVKRLKFNWVSNSELQEYLATTHPDVLEIINSKESSLDDAFYSLVFDSGLTSTFQAVGDLVFDFTRVVNVDIDKLLKMYILITKMYANDQPPKWLEEGSLEDYREYVELLWNGMTTYLVRLKKVAELYRARTAVLVENEASRLSDYTYGETGITVKTLVCDAVLYYSDKAMQMVEQSGNSLRDCAVASVYGRLTGEPVAFVDLMADKSKTTSLTSTYYSSIHNNLVAKAEELFYSKALEASTEFVNSRPACREALVRTLKGQDTSVYHLLREHLSKDLEKLFHLWNGSRELGNEYEVAERVDGGPADDKTVELILKTQLVPQFLRLCGCDLAAEIIELTFVKQENEDNLAGKRERLHVALIDMLAAKLLTASAI